MTPKSLKVLSLNIFKAYDRHRKRLIDWECGDRTAETFQRLYERLSPYQVLFYCADRWKGLTKSFLLTGFTKGKTKPSQLNVTTVSIDIGLEGLREDQSSFQNLWRWLKQLCVSLQPYMLTKY